MNKKVRHSGDEKESRRDEIIVARNRNGKTPEG
jgi:hypothetical protein